MNTDIEQTTMELLAPRKLVEDEPKPEPVTEVRPPITPVTET